MKNTCFFDIVCTHFLICNEKIKNRGEDSALKIISEKNAIIGVFDGCGGLGSAISSSYQGMTEAYVASRTINGAVISWYKYCINNLLDFNGDLLKEIILRDLKKCRNNSGNSSGLKGSMIRSYPSTMAVAAFSHMDTTIITDLFWTGDSRIYMLDKNGLGQMSKDDIDDEDAMSNLTRDGALTNVVSADGKFSIHTSKKIISEPCFVLVASDGCFGYLPSPMAFEELILSTLLSAENVNEWKNNMSNTISDIAGDDQSLVLIGFGFDNFADIKNYFNRRSKTVSTICRRFKASDDFKKYQLWNDYKGNYYRFQNKEL